MGNCNVTDESYFTWRHISLLVHACLIPRPAEALTTCCGQKAIGSQSKCGLRMSWLHSDKSLQAKFRGFFTVWGQSPFKLNSRSPNHPREEMPQTRGGVMEKGGARNWLPPVWQVGFLADTKISAWDLCIYRKRWTD